MIAYRLFIASWRETEADAIIGVLNLGTTPFSAIFTFDIWWLFGNILLYIGWGWAIELVKNEEEDENPISKSISTTSTSKYSDSRDSIGISNNSGGSSMKQILLVPH